jgi:hypothetical protein
MSRAGVGVGAGFGRLALNVAIPSNMATGIAALHPSYVVAADA